MRGEKAVWMLLYQLIVHDAFRLSVAMCQSSLIRCSWGVSRQAARRGEEGGACGERLLFKHYALIPALCGLVLGSSFFILRWVAVGWWLAVWWLQRAAGRRRRGDPEVREKEKGKIGQKPERRSHHPGRAQLH